MNFLTNLVAQFNALPLSKKIPSLFVFTVLVTCLISSSVMMFQASGILKEENHFKQEALLEQQSASLNGYLESIVNDMKVMTKDNSLLSALREFNIAYKGIARTKNPVTYLQNTYIHKNPNPTGSKHMLMKAKDGSAYSNIHAKYHPWFKALVDERGYYDVFLVNMSGDVVYTVFKELDYASNLKHGKWKDTDLAFVYKDVLKKSTSKAKDADVSFSDFKAYTPSFGVPASFMSRVIRNTSGKVEGVLIFQMPIGRLNQIMQSKTGMGKTGESFLIGEDLKYRSDSRFTKEGQTDILKTTLDPVYKQGVKNAKAFEGKNHGYSTQVMSQPFSFKGVNWTFISEKSTAEINEDINALYVTSIFVCLLLSSVLGALGIAIGLSVSKPITSLTHTMKELAEGNEQVQVPFKERLDELGEMAETVEIFKNNLVEKNKLDKHLVEMARRLEEEINKRMGGIKGEISHLTQTMLVMEKEAKETSENIKDMTYATSQMTEAANEINVQISHSYGITSTAAERTKNSSAEIAHLNETTHTIEKVVSLIRAIMERTNLLALNATIEAANAGEAGKSFTVVATQVKELANQTAQATDEIVKQIRSVQDEASQGKSSIEAVSVMLEDVFMASGSIAASVEEQTVTLKDISQNMNSIHKNTDHFMGQVRNVHSTVESVEKQVLVVEDGLRKFLREMAKK
jgi:methyl-accepting chemotaxis protein